LILPDEERQVGVRIERAFQDFKPFWPELLLNATQNLSGFLAVRSSGEDERQAQDFAPVAAHLRLFAIRELDGEFRRFAWNIGGEGMSGHECQREYCLRTHSEFSV
jgi:hypothetical protein